MTQTTPSQENKNEGRKGGEGRERKRKTDQEKKEIEGRRRRGIRNLCAQSSLLGCEVENTC